MSIANSICHCKIAALCRSTNLPRKLSVFFIDRRTLVEQRWSMDTANVCLCVADSLAVLSTHWWRTTVLIMHRVSCRLVNNLLPARISLLRLSTASSQYIACYFLD